MKLRSLRTNNYCSAVPLILYVITVLFCGALYTLFFLEVFYPNFLSMVPASDSKTLITMILYSIPLLVLLIGLVVIIRAGLKKYYLPVDQATYNMYNQGGFNR